MAHLCPFTAGPSRHVFLGYCRRCFVSAFECSYESLRWWCQHGDPEASFRLMLPGQVFLEPGLRQLDELGRSPCGPNLSTIRGGLRNDQTHAHVTGQPDKWKTFKSLTLGRVHAVPMTAQSKLFRHGGGKGQSIGWRFGIPFGRIRRFCAAIRNGALGAP